MTQSTCDNGTWYAKPEKPFEPDCCKVFEDSLYNSPLTDPNGGRMYLMCNDWVEVGYCDTLNNDLPKICPARVFKTSAAAILLFIN